MTKCLIYLASAVGLLASGCVVFNPTHYDTVAASDDNLKIGVSSPHQSEDSVYYILAAELAIQRGQYDTALDNYLKASMLSQDVKIIQRATQIAIYLKKNDKALETAKIWLDRQPDSIDARRLTAFLLIKAGRTDEAVDQLAVLLSTPGVDTEVLLIDLAKLLSSDVPKDVGLEFLQRLGERFPNKAEIHFAMALLATELHEYQTALAETEKALSQHPDWNKARLLQAQLMTKTGNSEHANEIMRKAIRNDPNNPNLRLIYSQYLAKAGDLKGANRELEQLVAKDPGNQDALLGLTMTQIELGQEAKAQQNLERLTESSNYKMQAYFYLGLLEARKKHFPNAVQWFDKVTEGPVVFDAQVNAITSLIVMGQAAEARLRLSEVRRKFPQQAVRLYLLEAELLTKDKQYVEAFDLLSQALTESPGQTDLLYSRALVAEELNQSEAMEADLKTLLEKNPDDPNALNALGFSLADRSERLEEAKGYIAKALQLKPDDPAILDSYGWVNYRLGDKEAALTYLGRAFAKLKDPEIGAHYGEVLWESGKQKEAMAIWKDLMRKYPDQKDLKKVINRYPEAFKK